MFLEVPNFQTIEPLNVGSRTNGHADVLSQANRKALTTHNLLQQETGKVSQLTDKVETLLETNEQSEANRRAQEKIIKDMQRQHAETQHVVLQMQQQQVNYQETAKMQNATTQEQIQLMRQLQEQSEEQQRRTHQQNQEQQLAMFQMMDMQRATMLDLRESQKQEIDMLRETMLDLRSSMAEFRM